MVGTPGDEFPFVNGALLFKLFKIGGVVGGVFPCDFGWVVVVPVMCGEGC